MREDQSFLMVGISWLPELLYNDAALAEFSSIIMLEMYFGLSMSLDDGDGVFDRNKV